MEDRPTSASRELVIGGFPIAPGERVNIDLPVASLYTRGEIHLPVRVVRGRHEGPTLFVCAAIHGDEINGVEIIRRLLRLKGIRRLHGTLIAVPIVNVFGFIGHSRYLPDRRDLNRSFPGSERGSLAARLADLFTREIVENCTHGIDLHTGAMHRCNLPQVRGSLDMPGVAEMARAFGAPVILDSTVRDGSLRASSLDRGIPLIVYEGGEAHRFEEVAIRAGLRGIVGVMESLGMLRPPRKRRPRRAPLVVRSSSWVRAPESGILRMRVSLGSMVKENEVLGVIGDPFGDWELEVRAPFTGPVIGRIHLPLVNEGDALYHIARLSGGSTGVEELEGFHADYIMEDSEPGV